jgi:hypothetical protein
MALTKRNGTRTKTAGRAATRVRVRMYRPGMGDCFLLTFEPDTPRAAHVLIDLGTIGRGGGVSLDEVVDDIVATSGGQLRAIVATHEHEDHLSGFRKQAQGRLAADEVWAAWTENPADRDAERLARYRGDLFSAIALVGARLERPGQDAATAELAKGVREVMAFVGLEPDAGEPLSAAEGLKKKVNEAMKAALALGKRRVFCEPGDVLERPWAPGVRFYVLGPPRDEAALKRMGEHGSPDLYELAAAAGVHVQPPAPDVTDDDDAELSCPFDATFTAGVDDPALERIRKEYDREPWRQIESAGMGVAADLALQLDNFTNNTCLVLAIEVDGRVLLFAADAQLGSWLSWQGVEFTVRDGNDARTVTATELLQRTVFYKVGHHGSHNATATASGLELMRDAHLTAFIPLDGDVAKAKRWPMPAAKLYERLLEKTHGQVFRSDTATSDTPGVVVNERSVDYLLPSVAMRTVQRGADRVVVAVTPSAVANRQSFRRKRPAREARRRH